jgi:hypothetical protein
VLADIARNDADSFVRRAALENRHLTDQDVLAHVARNDRDRSVRTIAVNKLTDSTALARVATTDQDAEVRRAAVLNSNLTDQEVLARVAKTDSETRVRSDAVQNPNLWDQALLAGIAADAAGQDEGRSTAFLALAKIADQRMLAGIATGNSDSQLRIAAVRMIEDKALLATVAERAEGPVAGPAAQRRQLLVSQKRLHTTPFFGLRHGSLEGLAGSVGVVLGKKDVSDGWFDFFDTASGWVVEGEGSPNSAKLSVGRGSVAWFKGAEGFVVGGWDVKLSLLHALGDRNRLRKGANYLGVEAGGTGLVNVNIGLYRGDGRWLFSWAIGVGL